jgi:hypothetical protein
MIGAFTPSGTLTKTESKLADVLSNIAELEAKKAILLASDDTDIAAVQAIDKHITAEGNAAEIYRQKIAALEERLRSEKFQAKEAERKKAIAAIGKKLIARLRIAEDYEASLKRTAELYQQLMASEPIDGLWPFGGMPNTIVNTPELRRELSWGLWGLLPEPHNRGLGVTGIVPIGLAGAVRQQNEAILAKLSYANIGHDMGDAA